MYAQSERYRNVMAGIFEIQIFLATSRFHRHRSEAVYFEFFLGSFELRSFELLKKK